MSKIHYRYFNNFFLNTFFNTSVKKGLGKLFKKKTTRLFLSIVVLLSAVKGNLSLAPELNSFLSNYYSYLIFFKKSRVTFMNHKKKYIQELDFRILKKKKRIFFLQKYVKYFFFKSNWVRSFTKFVYLDFLNDSRLSQKIFLKLYFRLVDVKKK